MDGLYYIAQEAVWDLWHVCVNYPTWAEKKGQSYVKKMISDAEKVSAIVTEHAKEFLASGGEGKEEDLVVPVDIYPLESLLQSVSIHQTNSAVWKSLRISRRNTNTKPSQRFGRVSSWYLKQKKKKKNKGSS